MKTLLGTVFMILTLALLGWVGSQDLEGRKTYEEYQCGMIESGSWGASKEIVDACNESKNEKELSE